MKKFCLLLAMLLAFPLAYLATVAYRLAPAYTWAAFVVGLGAAAILLSWRYARLSRNYLTA